MLLRLGLPFWEPNLSKGTQGRCRWEDPSGINMARSVKLHKFADKKRRRTLQDLAEAHDSHITTRKQYVVCEARA